MARLFLEQHERRLIDHIIIIFQRDKWPQTKMHTNSDIIFEHSFSCSFTWYSHGINFCLKRIKLVFCESRLICVSLEAGTRQARKTLRYALALPQLWFWNNGKKKTWWKFDKRAQISMFYMLHVYQSFVPCLVDRKSLFSSGHGDNIFSEKAK